jgi:hypothetical protein
MACSGAAALLLPMLLLKRYKPKIQLEETAGRRGWSCWFKVHC